MDVTIFTPTYNRRHTLTRVYESLCGQTVGGFEWLLIDDGSTDGTEELVQEWEGAPFPIRFVPVAHAGKHIAFNHAFELARGEFFINLDSDDAATPDCVERALHHARRLPQDYCSLLFLVRYDDGPVEGRFPHDDFDASLLDLVFRHRLTTDYRPCFRTHLLRQHRFEHVEGAVHVLEGTVFLELARHHLSRGVNECLFVLHRDPQPGNQLTTLPTSRNAPGMAHWHRYLLNAHLSRWFRWQPRAFLMSAAYYWHFSWLSGASLGEQWRGLRTLSARLLWLLAFPLGLALAWRHRRAQDVGRQEARRGQAAEP